MRKKMKKYVFTKGTETVTVETDGLGTIENFIVTGVLGKDYSSLVEAGFDFKMGDTVSSSIMLNTAKKCACKVDCYDGENVIVDESADFTKGDPVLEGVLKGLKVGIAYDEKTYYSEVASDYTETYSYEASKSSLPWLVVSFQKIENDAAEGDGDDAEGKSSGGAMELQIFANDRQLEFGGTSANAGTVSADKKTLTITAKEWVMFEIKNDLGVLRPELVTWFTARITYSGKVYEARCFVTPNII